jgi:hypothetical protein
VEQLLSSSGTSDGRAGVMVLEATDHLHPSSSKTKDVGSMLKSSHRICRARAVWIEIHLDVGSEDGLLLSRRVSS